MKKFLVSLMAAAMLFGMVSCSKDEQVIIYSNADDEAVASIKKALDENGFEGKYILQSFGTSELGGKLLAEGKDIEADLITMSSFYVESAQAQNDMFCDLDFTTEEVNQTPSFYSPMLAIQGALIVNTDEMKKNSLPLPVSIKDLENPVYNGYVSVVDINGSSTGWLMIQALVAEYGEEGAKSVLSGIYKNAGPHLEKSGSGPIKKVRAGEVAIGFGLRHQAVRDKKAGKPIDFVDPSEGNYALTESVAVINKDSKKKKLAQEMAECIIKNGRKYIIQDYPVVLYKGEEVAAENQASNSKLFPESLTEDLHQKHIQLSESCKQK